MDRRSTALTQTSILIIQTYAHVQTSALTFPAIVVLPASGLFMTLFSDLCGNLTLKTKDRERKLPLSSSASAVILWSTCYFHYWTRASWPARDSGAHRQWTHTHSHRSAAELPVQNNRYKYSSLWEKEYKHSVHPCSEEEHPVQCFLFSEAHTEKSTLSYSPRSQTDVNQLVSSVRRDSHDRPLC